MEIPHLNPEQIILFSDAGTDTWTGGIIPVKVKDIVRWEIDEEGEGSFISYIPENTNPETEQYLVYFDYYILPHGYIFTDEQQKELFEQTEQFINNHTS